MSNNAITKVVPWASLPRRPMSIWYSLYGTKGEMENNRWPSQQVLNLSIEDDPEVKYQKSYQPKFRKYSNKGRETVHGGADFLMIQDFVEAIIRKTSPSIDVYLAMDTTLPGILGYRSALQGNIPIEVPDFRKEEIRKKYENDHWSPDPKDRHIPGQPLPSVLGEIKIPDSIYQVIEKIRKENKVSAKQVRKIY